MKLNFKKIAAVALTAVMASAMMLPGVFAAETADAAPVDSITVDGVKEAAWDAATEYTMVNEVSDDSRGAAETKKDSSTVKFRIMYGETKVYLLFEIEDDVWQNGMVNTHWRNDSIFIYVSEDGTTKDKASEKSYQMVAYMLNADPDKAANTGFFVRNNGVNTKAKEHAAVIDGNKATVELSFEFNTITPEVGGSFQIDLQYNDQDLDPTTAEEQSRTIVWAWSAAESSGPNNNGGSWGTVNFAAAQQGGNTGGDNGDGENEIEVTETGDLEFIVLSVLAIAAIAGAAVIVRRRKVSE